MHHCQKPNKRMKVDFFILTQYLAELVIIMFASAERVLALFPGGRQG